MCSDSVILLMFLEEFQNKYLIFSLEAQENKYLIGFTKNINIPCIDLYSLKYIYTRNSGSMF